MREIRLSGSEGGGAELNRLSLPLSSGHRANSSSWRTASPAGQAGRGRGGAGLRSLADELHHLPDKPNGTNLG